MSCKFSDISSYMKTKGITKNCYIPSPSSTCPITCNTINSDLTINGNLNVNGNNIILDTKNNLELQVNDNCFIKLDASGIRLKKDIISSSNGLTLIKDNSNKQPSRLFGEIITVLDISGVFIQNASSDTIEFKLNIDNGYSNGIVYSNSVSSSNLFYNNGETGTLFIDVSNNQNHFIDSFFEIYINLDVHSGNPNTTIQNHFDLSGINTSNRFTIDTRSYKIKEPGNIISASYGPKHFLTRTNGILNDIYKLVSHIETDKNDVTFSNINFVLKQRIL